MFDTQLSDIWTEVLELLKKNITKPILDTWFKNTELVAYVGDTIIIMTPNTFAKNYIENNNLTGLIQQHLEHILNCPIKIQFITNAQDKEKSIEELYEQLGYNTADLTTKQPTPIVSESAPASPVYHTVENMKEDDKSPAVINETSDYDARYTFDTFVIGANNRFAHAACLAAASDVVNKDKLSYNPLFIYGGAGLGKTHLMRAITYYIKTHNPSVNICFVTSEKFTNEFIDSIVSNRPNSFREKYRNVDILLIDDIQFLSNKEGTQEELFHTFNELHDANKQIIISSDRQPKDIPTLEERLRTRFEWGLMIDIQPPDLETRVAILRKKAQLENMQIPDDVIYYIAENVTTNIRELEGTLTRVYAYANLNSGRPLDLALAQECLKNMISTNAPIVITGELIQQAVAETYAMKVDDFKAKTRARTVAYPRQIAMYLCREMTDMSLPKIGEIFGGRDHTTVIHAHEKIKNDLKNNLELQNTIEHIKNSLTHNWQKSPCQNICLQGLSFIHNH